MYRGKRTDPLRGVYRRAAQAAQKRQVSRGLAVRSRRRQIPRVAVIGAESHVLDTNNATDVTATGATVALNLTAEGAGDANRVGKKITMKGVEWRIKFSNEASATETCSPIRCMLIYDEQPNGALPAVTDMLESASVVSMKNSDNAQRFTILKDWYVQFNPFGATLGAGADSVVQVDHGYLPLKGLQTMYKGTTAVIGSVATGALLFFCIGDVASGTTDYNMDANFRLRFDPL